MLISRVLLAINIRWWNAEAAYAVSLARGLEKQGITVWLIVNPGSPVHQKAVFYGLSVITDVLLDSHSLFVQYGNFKRILRFIDQNEIQLVNSFKSNGSFLFTIARRFRPTVTYVKTRGIAAPPKKNLFNRFLYGSGSCDGVITVGTPVKKWMIDLLGEETDQNLEIIYYGSSSLRDVNVNVRKASRPINGIPSGCMVLALLGRTQEVKGHLLLLQAFAMVRDLNLHLLFLVKDLAEFPEVLAEIQLYIDDHHLGKRVTILGFQENLASVMSKIDCGVIPSLSSEVNCRVCVEFFSEGIPVIAFPTGTLPDIVEHKKNGFLCRDKTVEELVKAIEWIFDEPAAFQEAKKQAYKDYAAFYTEERLASETLLFYHKCKTSETIHKGMDDELNP